MQPSRPQSVAELVAQGENFSFNTNIPLKHWTRAAETLFREVSAVAAPHIRIRPNLTGFYLGRVCPV